MNENVQIAWVAGALALGGCALVSFVLSKIIALRSPPGRRAAWTSGLAAISALAASLSTPFDLAWPFVVAVLPAGLLTFWFWKREFHNAWVEDHEVRDDTKLANDDWRVGLAALAAVLVAAAVRMIALKGI